MVHPALLTIVETQILNINANNGTLSVRDEIFTVFESMFVCSLQVTDKFMNINSTQTQNGINEEETINYSYAEKQAKFGRSKLKLHSIMEKQGKRFFY